MELTPLLQQYYEIKNRYRDAILFFRVGDFYEMFYDDARVASKELGIILTSRPHGRGGRIPLAGVPCRAADSYIAKLVKRGYRVAICEQVERPDKRKKLVRREVVEVITPGMILRPDLLDEDHNHYLASVNVVKDKVGIAYADISSGAFYAGELFEAQLDEELKRLSVREIITPQKIDVDIPVTMVDHHHFNYHLSYQKLKDHFQVKSLDGYGIEGSEAAISAAGALLSYLEENQLDVLPQLSRIKRYDPVNHLYLDSVTRKNLELTEPISDRGGRTLYDILNQCLTPMGKRKLREWIVSPLIDIKEINDRLDAVSEIVEKPYLREDLLSVLSEIKDVERIVSRIGSERANPREIKALANMLKFFPRIKDSLQVESRLLMGIKTRLKRFDDLVNLINKTLIDNPPATMSQGGVIRAGYDDRLDKLRTIAQSGKGMILEFQRKEQQRTQISSLKVGYNSIFGYYIEVTKPNLHLVPDDYQRRQTLTNVERFTTQELKDLEEEIVTAENKSIEIEYEIFVKLRCDIGAYVDAILEASQAISELDVIVSFGATALRFNYHRPVVDKSGEVEIREGRHPVVEQTPLVQRFVPNNTNISEDERIHIITGPNMSGKSTYLRQVALITIMAQIGSFVPAEEARIGIADKIFTRIGASDDISRGVSTFLAEMMETANILNNMSEQSLIILDEIGRGTSSDDGLALAWAVVEYLSSSGSPRTLFATHFHELTEIARVRPSIKNFHFEVKEIGGEIVFLRRLLEGPSSKSYGISVAQLAGLPPDVISRAKEVLESFLKGEEFYLRNLPKANDFQLTFFPEEPAIIEELKKVELKNLSPIEALNMIARWKELYGGK
ncbi:MAG TPA: DNA mismatch repair protein MutS [bacterium (Candidatus Stahlbacteria)]|nr:DNA mismatch repair protein MutS [Candidatus Stahlbacteria bacterium]